MPLQKLSNNSLLMINGALMDECCCCYKLTNCYDPDDFFYSFDADLDGLNGHVVRFAFDRCTCWKVEAVEQHCPDPVAVEVTEDLGLIADNKCDECWIYVLTRCDDDEIIKETCDGAFANYVGKVVHLEGEGECIYWIVSRRTGAPPDPDEDFVVDEELDDCPPCYKLTNCEDSNDVLYTCDDLAAHVGDIVKIGEICYEISLNPDPCANFIDVNTTTTYETCEECLDTGSSAEPPIECCDRGWCCFDHNSTIDISIDRTGGVTPPVGWPTTVRNWFISSLTPWTDSNIPYVLCDHPTSNWTEWNNLVETELPYSGDPGMLGISLYSGSELRYGTYGSLTPPHRWSGKIYGHTTIPATPPADGYKVYAYEYQFRWQDADAWCCGIEPRGTGQGRLFDGPGATLIYYEFTYEAATDNWISTGSDTESEEFDNDTFYADNVSTLVVNDNYCCQDCDGECRGNDTIVGCVDEDDISTYSFYDSNDYGRTWLCDEDNPTTFEEEGSAISLDVTIGAITAAYDDCNAASGASGELERDDDECRWYLALPSGYLEIKYNHTEERWELTYNDGSGVKWFGSKTGDPWGTYDAIDPAGCALNPATATVSKVVGGGAP